MKNFVQEGDLITFAAAPYAVASGGGFKSGAFVAIAVVAAASGAPVTGKIEGVFTHAKNSADVWTVGTKVYWDDTAKVFTSVVGTNTLVGAAVEAAAGGITTGTVYLDGAIR